MQVNNLYSCSKDVAYNTFIMYLFYFRICHGVRLDSSMLYELSVPSECLSLTLLFLSCFTDDFGVLNVTLIVLSACMIPLLDTRVQGSKQQGSHVQEYPRLR